MKKVIFLILAAILLMGCSDQYAIEKKYYQVEKAAQKIFQNPHASPPQQLEKAVAALNKFAKKYPRTNLAIDAEFNIARLYIVKEEYNKAREYLANLVNEYAKSQTISSEVLFLIGNTYEIEGKWNSALAEYKKIIREYPLTLRGLNIPIYIAQHYKLKYQPDKMLSAYHEAISHYRALANKHAGSPLAFNCETLIAQCYIAMKEWPSAINTFNAIIATYKDKVSTDAILLDIALIYERELKDRPKAKETLERLIKDYPKSKLIKTADNLLKKLGAE